jgi:iron complex outermembrane receptor protein
VEGSADYSDYSFWYDNLYYTGYFARLFVDNDGNQLNPDAAFENYDYYTKQSHEIRFSTPQDRRVRGLVGLYYQKQFHDFYQPFGLIEGLADDRSMNGCDGSPCVPTGNTGRYDDYVYLNSMDRRDTDQAVFGSISFDITDDLELSLGARYFEPEVTVKGFFGFALGLQRDHEPGAGPDDILGTPDDIVEANEPGAVANGGEGAYHPDGQAWSTTGEWRCPSLEDSANDEPCQNVDKGISESDQVFRVNLSWDVTDDAMVYATWSEGYRPGGINRNPFAGDYVSDFLTNYEIGWKTRFGGDRVQFNGAIFLEEWDDIQVSFQGGNGITQVANGGGAEVKGIEVQLDWLATDNLRIGGAAAYYDSKLTDDYCDLDALGNCINVKAPSGTPLPLTPEFKANLIARYSFPLASFDAYTQGAVTYQDSAPSQLELVDQAVLGDIPSSTFLNLAFGLEKDDWGVELFVANATNEDAPLGISTECAISVCGVQPVAVKARPRTVGLRFTKDF